MIRALKHCFRHEWRTHPSMRQSGLADQDVYDHHFCAYPGCDAERLLVWSTLRGDFVWRTVVPS